MNGFWGRSERASVDVRVFNPFAPSNAAHWTGDGLELLFGFLHPFINLPHYSCSYGWLIQGLNFSAWEHFVGFCGTESVYLPVKPYIKGIKYTVAILYTQLLFILYSLYMP